MRAGNQQALRSWHLVVTVGTLLMFGYLTSRAGHIEYRSARTTFPIVAFELAGSGDEAERILSESAELLSSGTSAPAVRKLVETAVRKSLWWDFGFILGYSFLIFTLAPALGRIVGGPIWTGLGKGLGWGGLLAGLLDIVENVSLFQVLDNTSRHAWAVVAATVSWGKWILVAIVVAYGLGGLIGLGVAAIKRRVGTGR